MERHHNCDFRAERDRCRPTVMAENRLTLEELNVLEKCRQFFRHRTPENLRHLVSAIGAWIRIDDPIEEKQPDVGAVAQ